VSGSYQADPPEIRQAMIHRRVSTTQSQPTNWVCHMEIDNAIQKVAFIIVYKRPYKSFT